MAFLIFYTEKFVPEPHAGCSMGPFICIRPKYKDDIGLLEHEKVHRKQFFSSFGLFPLFYSFSEKYRFNAEVEAYREQLKHYDESRYNNLVTKFANFIVERYNLSNVTVEQAKEALTSCPSV